MNRLTQESLQAFPLPQHKQGDNKEGRGQVLLVGGSLSVPGAILLSAEGALRAGAGKLQIATCRSIAPHPGLTMPEAMVIGLPESDSGDIANHAGERLRDVVAGADAVLLGPGMSGSDGMPQLVDAMLEAGGPRTAFVFDAGALCGPTDCLSRLHSSGHRTVITPHAGEMSRLLDIPRDAISADPLRYARQAAAQLRCTVVMKGGTTYIVGPDSETWMFDGGTIGLATSGSGDVLAGVIAGLLARGTPAIQAAIWGVYLHAEAGNRLTRHLCGIGLLAREIPGEIPRIMAEAQYAPNIHQ